jgi:hypothetical protein
MIEMLKVYLPEKSGRSSIYGDTTSRIIHNWRFVVSRSSGTKASQARDKKNAALSAATG